MTEEIIIDGINVAGCKHYDDGICCNDDVLTLSCEKTNCMYKQLKRLEFELKVTKADYEASEQENKELKEYSQRMENQRENYYKEYNNYRFALEEIREIVTGNYEVLEPQAKKDIENKINEVLNP